MRKQKASSNRQERRSKKQHAKKTCYRHMRAQHKYADTGVFLVIIVAVVLVVLVVLREVVVFLFHYCAYLTTERFTGIRIVIVLVVVVVFLFIGTVHVLLAAGVVIPTVILAAYMTD